MAEIKYDPRDRVGALSEVLREKKTVITRAVFWKIPHNSGQEDICLKIGRYQKSTFPEKPETLNPKSELTLDDEEFRKLVNFLQDKYEPFKYGSKSFIPLENAFVSENAEQLKGIFGHPQKENFLQFVITHNIIPEDFLIALEMSQRSREVRMFEEMLQEDLTEHGWQDWFRRNSWVLGTEFVRVLDERRIDTQNISDFLVEAYDGFLDIVEIKRPEGGLKFWSDTLDHGNYVPSSALVKAITQCTKYIYEVERESNSIKFLEKMDSIRTVKPRSVLIFGRSNDWNREQKEAYRILNSGYHNITIMTYDHVLERAKRIVGLNQIRMSVNT